MRSLRLVFALVTSMGCGAQPTAPVYSTGKSLVDQQGRVVVLRGVNIRAAGFFDAYHGMLPLPPFDADDCRVVGDDLGMNSLRLPINWSLLEPSRGSFDQSLIDRVLALASACAQHGVYTLVDLHQDGWSKYVGADGAPFWAHSPALPPEDADERAGNQATTTAAVQAAFAGFFGDAALMQDYAAMTAHLAHLIDRQPGIIGLEIMNEPLIDQAELDALYRLVVPAVRDVAPGLPLYFEPEAIRNIIDVADPEPLAVANTVYSPHLYTGVFQGNWMVGQTSRIEDSIVNMLAEATRARGALMITELGNNPVDPAGAAWLTDAYALLDKHVVSASLWVYEEWPSTCGNPVCWGLYDETPATGEAPYARSLRTTAMPFLARAYPQAIAGGIDTFSYDVATRTLVVTLTGAGGSHVLAAPALVYPGGVTVTCDGAAVPATQTGARVEASCSGARLVMKPAGG